MTKRKALYLLGLPLIVLTLVSCGVQNLFQSTTVVTIVYGSEKEGWLEPLVAEYNTAEHLASDGTRIVIEAEAMGSVESAERIISGDLQPTVWSPASSIYIPVANDEWRAVNGDDLVVGTPNDLVLSPVVIAMWDPMARALGWPEKELGWSDIFELSAADEGWDAYGFPEWGEFKFGHTHPEFSNSGVTSVLAEAYAGAGKTADLTSADLQDPAVQDFMGQVEKSVIHYGRSTGFFALQLFERGPSYLSATVLYENLIVEQETKRLAGESFQLPVVAIYPKEGTFWSNHPYAVVNAPWVSDIEREAALDFEAFLLDRPQQEQAIQLGFRPADPTIQLTSPLDQDHGIDINQPSTILEVPSGEVTSQALELWQEVKKPVDLVIVMDISGSMSGNKIDAAQDSLSQFVDLLSDRDRVQVILFSDQLYEMTPLNYLSDQRQQLQEQISTIQVQGGTRLYDAVSVGYEQLLTNADEDHIKAMVVLTDGQDTDSGMRLDELSDQLASNSSEGGNAPKIFTIAFGDTADSEVLATISDTTGGRQFSSTVDNISDIYAQIATFF